MLKWRRRGADAGGRTAGAQSTAGSKGYGTGELIRHALDTAFVILFLVLAGVRRLMAAVWDGQALAFVFWMRKVRH